MTKNEKSESPAKSAEVWSVSPEERAEILARVGEARRSGSEARYLMAKATHLVVSTGAIGEGRIYADQNAYAAALGVSKSSVTGLKYLGAVVAATGITPDHKDWGSLSARASSLGSYVKAQQKDGKPITLTGSRKAVGAAVAAAETSRKAQAEARATRTAGGSTAPASDLSVPMDNVTVALATIRDLIPTLDAAQARTVANSLTTLAQSAQDRVKAAKVSTPVEAKTA